ncbi:MAG: efflux RND transporter periplasmic adaptor subunit [Aestuariivirga sp.]
MKQLTKTPRRGPEVERRQEVVPVKSGQVVAATQVPESGSPVVGPKLWSLARWIGVLVVVLGGVWYFGQNVIFGPIVLVDQIKRQNVIQTVVASGQIQAPFQVKIGAQVSGIVRGVPVSEGQLVQAGDTLIQLDDSDAHEAVKLAQAATAQWRAKLQQLTVTTLPAAQEAQAQTQANLDAAQTAFDRADKLLKQGAGTRVDFENAQKALLVAQSQLRAAQLQISSSQPSGTDYMAAQAQLDQAMASQRSAETKLSYYQIRAPFGGTLLTRSVDPGNTVQPGTVLMVLSPAGGTQVVVQIDEVNLGLLKLGQKALVSADAYPKQNFEGVVDYISPSVTAASGSIEAHLSIAKPPEYLRQDMTASVEIEVARRDNAIVVQSADVHDLLGGKPWVYAVVNGKAHRQPITPGTVGDDAVEVLDGVKDGDTVLKGQATGVNDGQRVRVNTNG